MSPKRVDHDARRAEIVDAATELFYDKGFESVGIRGLAASMGVSKSLLYHYFPTKEALFDAVCDSLLDRDLSSLQTVLTNKPTKERIELLFQAILADEFTYRRQLVLFLEHARVSSQKKRGVEIMREATSAYVEAFSAALELDKDTCAQLFCAINGLVLTRLLTDGEPDLSDAASWWSSKLGGAS